MEIANINYSLHSKNLYKKQYGIDKTGNSQIWQHFLEFQWMRGTAHEQKR